ncbi:hypothetical protein GCM10020000_22300 [Streptomyces olivoverticillatus]
MYSLGGAALQHPGGAREEADLVHHRGDLFAAGERQRLAGVLRLGGDQLLGARLDGVGDLQERLLAVAGDQVAPDGERGRGGGHGGVDVGGPGQRSGGIRLARGRIDHLRGPPVGGVPELPVDEIAQTTQFGGHVPPLLSRSDG